LRVNRGPAYLDGKIFRGTEDGDVLAYDAASGGKPRERVYPHASIHPCRHARADTADGDRPVSAALLPRNRTG